MTKSAEKKKRVDQSLLRLINQGIKKAGSRAKLAKAIGLKSPSTINAWRDGTTPNADAKDLLIRFVGKGDANSNRNPLRLLGSVSAGFTKLAYCEDGEIVEFDYLWKGSRYHTYTNKGQPICLLRVDGDSMSPEYPGGSLIAVREAADQDLPKGTPCILREGEDEYTFKLFSKDQRGTVLGVPINRDCEVISFKDPTVAFVVLGLARPW